MATSHLRDRINILNREIQQAELEIFNHNLKVLDAEVKTGDKKTDATLAKEAENSRSSALFWKRKLSVRQEALVPLEKELTEEIEAARVAAAQQTAASE